MNSPESTPEAQRPTAMAEEASVAQKPRSRWVRHALAGVISLLFGVFALILFTRHNDFPPHYHPDEIGKAQQLTDPRVGWNFRHPLMMLETANLLKGWFDVPPDERSVVIAGRWASAVLTSIGVMAVALAGYVGWGFMGLVSAGVMVLLCPALLIHAHYFKEDASLVAGVMLALLGARLTVSARHPWAQVGAAVVLGLGVAAGTSGKAIGVITLVPAVLAISMSRVWRYWALAARVGVFLLVAVLAIRLINARAFVHWASLDLMPAATSGLGGEIAHAQEGHFGVRLGLPNLYGLRLAAQEMLPSVWILLVLGLLAWAVWSRRISLWGVVLMTSLLSFVVLLSFNRIPMPRYGLPITVLMYFITAELVAMGLLELNRRSPRATVAAGIGSLALVLAFQGGWSRHLLEEFRYDARYRLREWVATLPAGTTIVMDRYTLLNLPGDPWRHPDQPRITARLLFRPSAADWGTLENVLRQNAQYVALADGNWDRFFAPGVEGTPGEETWFADHVKFYEDVFTRGKLVWSTIPKYSSHSYVDMDLRVYDISHLRAAPAANPPTAQ